MLRRRRSTSLPLSFLQLEDRVVPAFTSSLSGATAKFTGDGAADTLILDTAGGLLRHNRFTAGDAGFASDFDFNSGTPGDQTLSAAAASTVNFPTLGGGDDVLVLGSATSPASTLLAAISVSAGGPGIDALRIDDSARTTSNTYTTTSTGVTATGLNVTNLAIFETGVTLLTGSAGDSVTVQSTSSAETFTLNTGAGADTIRVTASGLASPLTVDGGGPVSPTSPGDTLIYSAGDAVITRTPGADSSSGSFSVPGQSAVTFVSIETQLAGPIVVSNIGDTSDGNFASGQLTLREAIELANTGPGADTITFQAGLTGTITLAGSQLPTIIGDTTITGPGAAQLAISGNDLFRIFTVDDGTAALVTVGISGLTLRNGRDGGGSIAGAIFTSEDLTLTACTVSNNTKNGAVFHTGGLLTVVGSTFSGNQNDNSAAAILASGGSVSITDSTFTNNTGSGMGAVFTDTAATITNSTFSGNKAAGTGGFGGGGAISHRNGTLTIIGSTFTSNIADNSGGAIRSKQGEMKVSNSTFAGNNATGDGGAVYTESSSTTTLSNSTLSGNTASSNGGGIRNLSGTVTISNTIVAGNFVGTTADDVNGAVVPSSSNNLIGVDTNLTGITNNNQGNQIGTAVTPLDAKLGPLANNGGPTQTRALLAGSSAFNAGSIAEIPAGVTTDARGLRRIALGTVDIGAFETAAIAGPYSVDSASDGVDGDFSAGKLTLREAVLMANDIVGADAITFSSLFYTPQTILLTTGELTLTDSVTITGPGANLLTISGNHSSRIFNTSPATQNTVITLNNLTLTAGKTSSGGGAIFVEDENLTIADSVLIANSNTGGTSLGGGAIFVSNPAATLNLLRTTVAGNSALGIGGGIGLRNGGTATIIDCTLSGNTANAGRGGGAFYSQAGNATFRNSTIANNAVTNGFSSDGGGGIRLGGANFNGTAIIDNCTIVNNTSPNGGGILFQAGTGTITIRSTIVAGNSGGAAPDITSFSGRVIDISTSAISSTAGITFGANTGNIVGQNLKLLALANNGGPVQTMAFDGSSPLRNKGSNPANLATDARGKVRNSGGGVDIGAYEFFGLPMEAEFSVGRDRTSQASVTLRNVDNSVRYTLTPFGTAFTGGIRTAAGDVNGDGVADLIVASGPGMAGTVKIFDGQTQAQIPLPETVAGGGTPFGSTFTKGIIVAVGDLNADGLSDLIITAEAGGGARVRIFQSTGSGFVQRSDFIALIGGTGKGDTAFRGGSRAAVSDINGDGTNDLIWAAGAGGGPRIASFNGTLLNNGSNAAFKLSGDFFALATTLRDGAYLGGGDIDGDGIGDVVFGGGSGAPPQVVGYSGTTITQNKFVRFLDFKFGTDSAQGIRVAVKDLNNDNIADVIVGSAPGAGSRVAAFNGNNLRGSSTGTAIFDFTAFSGFSGGVFVG